VRPAELVRVMPCRAVAYTARKWSAILNRQVLVAMCADAVALVYVRLAAGGLPSAFIPTDPALAWCSASLVA
jgi:hypothetical protein